MIRDAQQHNENAMPKDFEIDVLMEALPHYFDGDGNFKMEKFQNMLQEEQVELSRESYELNFLGKSYARLLASLETETVIVPNEKHNADERNADSENIYITGDNLDALKHLAKSYRGKVKCIYIDPPYNTGSDEFAYNDSFDFTADDLVDQIGATEHEAERILDLQGKASHSAWLTFMLPRLVTAKTLLTDDGVIFISIDDNEVANLINLCNEIFGEDNHVSTFVWKNKTGGGNDSKDVTSEHEYCLLYARNKTTVTRLTTEISDGDSYKLTDEFVAERGPYKLEALYRSSLRYSDSLFYPITAPDGSEILPNDSNPDSTKHIWRWSKATLENKLKEGRVEFKNTSNGWRVFSKQYLLQDDEGNPRVKGLRSVIDTVGSRRGTEEVKDLFRGKKYFSYPKPVDYLSIYISAVTEPGDIVMDFFSGSGSTAHAVMNLNAQDLKGRTYIAVQIAEELAESEEAFKDGYTDIDQVGRKRIELAADKIKQDTGADIDYGFKHYTLETPPQSVIDSLEDFAPDDNLFSDDPLESLDFDGTSADNVLLTTWIVHDGYGLNPEIEKVTLSNYELTIVGNTAYAIDGGMSSDDIRVLTQKLEDGEIDITNFVYFHTAIGFERLRELDSALRHLRNRSSVTITARW